MDNLISGTCAGFASKAVVAPLDLLKTRMQCNFTGEQQSNIWKVLATTVKNEGVASLYRGFSTNVFGSGLSWGIYFFVYNQSRKFWASALGKSQQEKLAPQYNFLSAATAGITSSLALNPIWMVKTRLQLQGTAAATAAAISLATSTATATVTGHGMTAATRAFTTASAAAPPPMTTTFYTGPIHAFRSIVKEEGVRTLYKGIGPALSLVSNGAFQFMAYEELLDGIVSLSGRKSRDELNSTHHLAAGALAKMMSSSLTYPLQVMRARLYQKGQKKSVASLVKSVYQQEGWRAFYKGLTPQLMKVAPCSAITMATFEYVRTLLSSRKL